jgi:hypothetical protein
MDFKSDVKPCDWVKYFGDLYSRKSNSGSVYETHLIGPQYIEELDSDFMKEEIRERIPKMKNNKATGFDGIPAEMWKMFCTMKGGIEILVEMFKKVKKGKGFPGDWKIAVICLIYKGINGDSLVTTEGSHFYPFYARYILASWLVDWETG